MSALVVGIDGGGTNTCLMLADHMGRSLRYGVGGSGNQNVVGLDTLKSSVCEAAAKAGLGSPPFTGISCVVAGLSGVDGPKGAMDAEACLGPLFPGAVVKAVADIDIALRASLNSGTGVVVIAGTGAMAYGHDGQGNYASSSGWGPLAGDEGSAYYIGRCGLEASLKAYDGRGPATSLLGVLLDELGVSSRQDIVTALYGGDWTVSRIADLAKHVTDCATAGDAVALSIVESAARELAAAAIAVLRQLKMDACPAEVAVAGGLLSAGPVLFDPLRMALARETPLATLVSPRWPPILGSVIMALEELGLQWKAELVGTWAGDGSEVL